MTAASSSTSTSPRQASPPPVRRPFFLKIASVVGILSTVALVGLGLTVLRANEETLGALARERQQLAAEDVVRSLEDAFRETEDLLESVGRVIVDPAQDPAQVAGTINALVASASGVDSVAVYDAQGELIDRSLQTESHHEWADPLPASLDAALRSAAERNGSAQGPVDRDHSMLTVVPIRVSGQATGFVAARVPLRLSARYIDQLSTTHFSEVENPIFVVDAEDRIVLSGDEEAAIAPSPAMYAPLLSTSAHDGAYVGAIGSGDTESIATSYAMPGRPLRVIVHEPTSLVYESLARLRLYVIGAVILAIVFSLVLSFWLAQRLTAPIRKLVAQADHLAHRRFDQRVSIDTSDELGVLGFALSHAAEDLEASEVAMKKEVAIRQDLGRYLPSEIVDRVVAREQDMGLGGSKRPITVLFADVVGFTPLTERLAPEDTVKLLNELFTLLTEIVFRHGGTLDKFMGDSVMAVFGAPTSQEDHATRALSCAEDMLRFLETGNAGWKERWGVNIELAIGVSSGDAVVGNIGSEARMEYTAIGDIVNIAARLEAIARPNQILMPKATADLVGDTFELVDRGMRELPGKKGEIHLFEVVV